MSHDPDPDLHTLTFSAPSRPPPPPPPSPHRPTLTSVLRNAAPAPFSLARFAHFLHDQHCIEILTFTQAIADYRAAYHAHFPFPSFAATHIQPSQQPHPHALWRDLIDSYVSTRAAHQVNLHGRVRENLLAADRDVQRSCGKDPPPEPAVLDEAEESMLELLGDVFAHFVERAVTPAVSRAASLVSVRRGSRGGGEEEGVGEEGEGETMGGRMQRNFRDLAAKAGNLVRGREGERERGRRRG